MTTTTVGLPDLLRDWADEYPPSEDARRALAEGRQDDFNRIYWLELSAAWMGITPNEYRRRYLEPDRFAELEPRRSIYYVSAERKPKVGALVKIGMTVSLSKRLGQLRSSSPTPLFLLASEPGGVERERAVHDQFAECRRRGEWFEADEALVAHIGGLRT